MDGFEVEENRPAIEENRPAIEENRPAIEEYRPAIEENRPAIEENRLAIVQYRPAIEENRSAIEENRTAIAVDISPKAFILKIDGSTAKTVLRYVGTGAAVLVGAAAAIGLTAFYYCSAGNKEKIADALSSALERKLLGAIDPKIESITCSSLAVVLQCYSQDSFFQFFNDYDSGKVKKRLSEEFSKIDITDMTVEIENEEEVRKQREIFRSNILREIELRVQREQQQQMLQLQLQLQ